MTKVESILKSDIWKLVFSLNEEIRLKKHWISFYIITGYVQTQSTATLPSTVYSSGYMQSVQSTIPTTVYGGGYVQSVQGVQQHNSQYYSGIVQFFII